MRPAATSPVPRAAPGGRTLVNSPPANTLPLLTASAHTAALVCHWELGRAPSVAGCVVSGAGPGSGAVGEIAAQAGRVVPVRTAAVMAPTVRRRPRIRRFIQAPERTC